MEDNSRIDDFYNDLVQSGFTFGGKTDRASYDAMMADDARSKKLYGILTDRGWDLDDYDTWRNGFSSQSQQNSAIMAPQGGGENGNEFTAEQLDGIKDPYQTAQTPQQVQQPMNTSRLDPKYQLNEDGSVKPYNLLEQEKTVDDNGNTQWKPKLVKGAYGTDVYRNAMTGEEYNPLSAEAMGNVGQNRMDPHQYATKTNDPSWGETLGKGLGAGFTRMGAQAVDLLQMYASGRAYKVGDKLMLTPSYEEMRNDKNNELTKASDMLHATADRMSQEAQPHGGKKGFIDLLLDGEIGTAAQMGLATAGESLPITLSAFNPYTMVGNGILMAAGNYRDQTIENPDVPEWKRATYAVGKAAIEQAVEKYADPVFKYFGGNKEAVKKVTKEATESIAKRIYKALGGFAKDLSKDMGKEGMEEVATNFGNDALGSVLDWMDGQDDYGYSAQFEALKKENPDADLWDFAKVKAKENVEAFLGGAISAAYTSGGAQGLVASAKGLSYAVNRDSKQEVPDGVKLDPVTVNVAQSFDDGYKFEIPQEKNDAKIMYDVQRERMNGIVDEDTLNDIEKDPVSWIVSNKGNLDADDLQTVLDYANAKATYDGMIQKVRDDIDSQCAAFDKLIDSRTNRAGANAGMLVPATMKMNDRQVFVIDGDIRMMDDGSMVDASKSSESILVCDAETGKVEFVSPHDVMNVGEAVNAEEEKARVREDTTRQIAQEQANQMEGVLPFNVGDEYALVDDKGEKHTVKVIADNIEGNTEGVVVLMDGVEQPTTKEVIQDWSQRESRGRAEEYLAQKTADNAAANGAEQNNAGSQQRGYALDDEVVLRDADGNGVRGTIVSEPDADGLYEVETAMPINGKRVNQWSADEIGAMLMEHNGEAVSQREPTVNAEPEANATGTVADEQQPSTAAGTVEEPMPMIGEGDDTEPDFLATTPERGLSFLFGESQWDESDADDFLNSNVNASAKEVEKIEGKRPKAGTNFAKFNKDMAAWNASKQEAEAKAKYWKQMKDLRDAELAKQKAERDAAEKARQEAATDQAIAEEEDYAAEQAQKAAEQAELGSNNVAPAIRDKWNNAQKTVGSADEIVLANGEKITGHYVLVESGVASPSHNANNGFTKTEGFPVDENGNSVNDRDYERDQDAQRITRDIASRYDSRALQTPVVVSQDGVVLSGNGRTMAGEIAAADGTDGAYNQYVKDRAAKYGFTTEQVEKMQHPRVVFVPDASLPYTAETFAKFNQQEMKGQNKTEQAVKLGKVVDDATFNRIVNIIDRFDTLGEFYADPKASREAISELQSAGAISQAQLAEMLDGDGISAIGRDLLENMLVGKAFENNPDAVREISSLKSMRQSVIKALGEILNNVKLGEDYSLEAELAGAIDLVYKARKEGGYKEGERVSGFARQMNLGFLGEDMTVADMNNVTMLEIADILNSGHESRLRVYMQNYNTHAQESAAGQLDLFSGEVMSKEDILNDVNNIFNNGTEQETADTRAEGVAEDGAVNNGGAESNRSDNGEAEQQQGNLQKESINLSDEVDEHGKQFVLNSNGEIAFGNIEAESGLTPAPILLSEGMITDPATNAGYGYVHIEARHGKEIRKAGYKSVLDFIEEVANNYEVIREAKDRDGNKTYFLQLTDKHNNTLIVELSGDGTYWNINTAGIFKTSYGAKNREVYNRHTTVNQSTETDSQSLDEKQSGTSASTSMLKTTPHVESLSDGSAVITPTTDAASANVSTNDALKSGEQSGSASNQSNSAGKGSNNSATEQAKVDENNGFSQNEAETEGADGNSSPVATAIAAAEAETDTNPSEAQKEAGNYKKGHVKVDGYDITIENPKGSVRSGKDADGKEWSVTMNNTYGYIRGTEGVDGDHIDVFLSDNPEQGNVYVVDQVDADGNFDEHKVMYGFGSAEEARDNYLANYSEGWKMGTITEVSKEEFKKWIESSHRKTKPFSEYKSVKKEGAQGEAQSQQPSTAAVDKDDTAYRKGESLKDYMQRNGDYPETKREYMVAKYGSEKVDAAVELFADYNDGKAADIAQKLYDLGIKDKEEAMAIYDFAFDKKYVHTPNTIPFIDAFFDLVHSKNKKQQPSTAAVQTNARETANENASETQPSTDAEEKPRTENVTEAQQLATEAIITALGENAGLDVVMETREDGQRVAAEQNADTEMMALSNNEQEFDSMKKMAHDENGHVLPGLAEKTVTVVPLREHGFAGTLVEAIKKAKEWAKSNLAGKEYDFPEGGKYVISNKAIGKYLSSSAFTKSDNSNVHLAALRMLPEIIGNSMDAEIHEDYKKGEDGKRNVNNGVENENKLVHRLYGAVTLGDKTYRVKTTMYEYRDGELKNNTPHSYEITEIELLDSPVLPAEAVKNTIGISNNSITGANLLKNVEKSYDNGVKILENQQNTADNKEELKRSDGTVYGWSEGNRIHLTPEGINPNTPIHEYTHLWARAVMQKNPKLWNRIKELLQGTPIWEEVVNDPAYQGLTTDDAIASEALSRLSGRKNAGKMEKMAQDLLNEAKGNGVFAEANAHTLILKMKQALKDFWKWVGTNLFDMTDVKNIDEVTDRVLYDLLNKTDIALGENGDVATEFQVVTDDQVNTDIRFRERTEFDDGEVIDIVGNRGSQDYSLADSTMPSYSSKEELLHAFQEKHPAYAAVLTADGNGIEVTAWKSVLDKNIRKPRRRNGEPTKAEKQRAAYMERKTQIAIANVNEKAQKLGLNVEVITDTESLPEKMADKKGWYNKVTGKITIVLPNHSNGQDVMRTLMHEGVAHHGLRQMFGEDFDTFLDNVYANADEEVRKRIAELAARKGWDFHVATEEYLAALAEDIDFERKVDQTWWQKVKFFFIDMLRKAGIVLDDKLTDNDLRYIVWKSYERMAYAGEYGAIRDARTVMMDQQLGTGNFGTRAVADGSQVADGSELLFRGMDQRDHATIRDSYEREIKTATYQMREAVQDSMLSLRRMMEEIEKATGNKIADYENAYMAENALSSKNLDEQRMYKKMLFEPMLDEVYRLAKEEDANGDKPGRDGVTRYMMAKHGLERQKLMEARAEQAGEKSDRDFAGLTGLFETDDLADAIQQAEQLVADFESAHKVDDLWKKVNACTKSTLEKSYKCGIISKEGYERISKMYDFYIPLRGFKEDTSDKIYAYLNHETGSFQSPVRGAFGRETVASDIFANILNMADSAIAQGNKNLVKQKFLKMVMNHPTDLASVNKMWLKKNDITGEWEAVTAQLDPNDSAEQVFQKTEAFEENMAQLAESDPDHYKRGKDLKDIPYRVLGNNLSEHQVYVKMGGQDYIITINGNPRVAQAVNGLSNPDSNSKILGGKLVDKVRSWTRWMAQNFTTRNPEFVLSNFLRDATYANTTIRAKEPKNYAVRYNQNFTKVGKWGLDFGKRGFGFMLPLLMKYEKGTLDMNNEMEKAFKEFMQNGGETGYTHIRSVEENEKDVEKYLKMKDGKAPLTTAYKWLTEHLDYINRSVENRARFAAFLTSRQMGRTVERSVMDAKEVSVNFNKKGAGSQYMDKAGQTRLGNAVAGLTDIATATHVFFNAGVQGDKNFAGVLKHAGAKAVKYVAYLFLAGLANAAWGGGDDDKYKNLTPYERRNNICFKVPGTDMFVKIPLGVEFRTIYGLGELAGSMIRGYERMSPEEIMSEIAGLLSQVSPIDMMEGGKPKGKNLLPSLVRPEAELYDNEDFMGRRIHNKTDWNGHLPEWKRAGKHTNASLIKLSRKLNEWTQFTDEQYIADKGLININPSVVEHLVEGHFGGLATFFNKGAKVVEYLFSDEGDDMPKELELRNIPMASRVLTTADENAEARRVNNEFYKYYNEYLNTKKLVNMYSNQQDEGVIGAAEKYDFLYNSPEYGRYEIVDDKYDEIRDKQNELKEEVDPQRRIELEEEITDLKREMIEAVRNYDDARNNR